MENEYGIGTILNNYTYTLPTGNTISVTAPNNFLANLKAKDQFKNFQAQGNFTNLTETDLGTPSAQRADAQAYITAGLDIPEGTKITQNMREVADSLTQKGYIVENDTITKVPPSADPEVKSAFVKKLQEHIVGLKEIPTDQLSIYDINGDGSIGTGDVVNALRGFKNLGQTEEINNKITSAFSNFIENSPELSSKAMVERIQKDIDFVDNLKDARGKVIANSLDNNQKAALVSLIYNIGQSKFLESKAYKEGLAVGNIETFKEEAFDPEIGFVKDEPGGKILPGLVNRRKSEKELFETAERQRVEETAKTGAGSAFDNITIEELEGIPKTRSDLYGNRFIKRN